jgi:DNA-3-methyladenine glycosylase
MNPLGREFFARDTTVVAQELLGKILVKRDRRGRVRSARIVETEAYHGPDDQASHAHGGPTPRSAIMFGEAGHAYVYQIYGMWFCLNAVTGPVGFPSAVLIRAAQILDDEDLRAGAGPGKLCAALEIDRVTHNGVDLCAAAAPLCFTDDGAELGAVASGPRIGVDYAGTCAARPWRYWLADHPSVSRLPPRRAPSRAKRKA